MRREIKQIKTDLKKPVVTTPVVAAPVVDPDDDAAIEAAAAAQAGVDDGTTPQDGAGTTDLKSATDSTPNGVSGSAPGGTSTPEIKSEGVDVDTTATAGLDAGTGTTPAPLTPEQEKEKKYIEQVASAFLHISCDVMSTKQMHSPHFKTAARLICSR